MIVVKDRWLGKRQFLSLIDQVSLRKEYPCFFSIFRSGDWYGFGEKNRSRIDSFEENDTIRRSLYREHLVDAFCYIVLDLGSITIFKDDMRSYSKEYKQVGIQYSFFKDMEKRLIRTDWGEIEVGKGILFLQCDLDFLRFQILDSFENKYTRYAVDVILDIMDQAHVVENTKIEGMLSKLNWPRELTD